MKKLSDYEENHLVNQKKRKISMNLLWSYLLILLAPAAAIIAIYFMVQSAMMETQKERVQGMLTEAASDFNREVEQAKNVGYYVSRESRLREYLYQSRPQDKEQEFFAQYKIASNYPNYTMINQIIKNVFILVADSRYIMKLPQVIPQTERGVSMMEGFPFDSYESFVDFYGKQDKKRELFFYAEEAGRETLFLSSQVSSPDIMPEQCAIVVQLDWNRIGQMLRQVLAGKDGTVVLLDEDDRVLVGYEIWEGSGVAHGMALQQMSESPRTSGGGYKRARSFTEPLVYNGWRLEARIPEQVLMENMGTARYAAVVLCIAALFLGVFVCLSYWYERKNLVQEYFRLQERMATVQKTSDQKTVRFWKSFDRFLVDVDKLMESVNHAGLSLKDAVYCVVDIEFGTEFLSGSEKTREDWTETLEALLAERLVWKWQRCSASDTAYVVLLAGKNLKEASVKESFCGICRTLEQEHQMCCYVGVSEVVPELLSIGHQYETAYANCAFAKDRGLDVPVLPGETPHDELLVFSMDMEMKLVHQIQNGTEEQMEELLSQIESVYFRPGHSRYTYSHTLEMLRGCVLRCTVGETDEVTKLRLAAIKAAGKEQMFERIRETRSWYAASVQVKEDVYTENDRKKIVEYIESQLGDANFNLSVLAEWLGEPERKLYNDFKLGFGVSFSAYLEQQRITQACRLLKEGTAVKEIAQQVGYSSDYSFRRAFKRVVGLAPSEFRKVQNVDL